MGTVVPRLAARRRDRQSVAPGPELSLSCSSLLVSNQGASGQVARDIRRLDMSRRRRPPGRPLHRIALGRRSTIVGVPPSAVPNFAKSLIVVTRRGFSDAARRSIVSRGLGTLHALRTLVFRSRTAWLRRFQGPPLSQHRRPRTPAQPVA